MSDVWDWTPEEVIEAVGDGDIGVVNADEINDIGAGKIEVVFRTADGDVVVDYEVQSEVWVHDEDGIQDKYNIDQP